MPAFYDDPAGKFTVALQFNWGAANVARYIRWGNDVVFGGQTFLAEDSIDVRTNPQHGGVRDVPYTVTMKYRPPLTSMVRPYAHAEVTCTIFELDGNSPDTKNRVVWKGRISKTVENAAGKPGLCQFDVSGWKSLIQYPLGLPVLTDCPWTLGDKNCCADITTTVQTCVISSITSLTTISVPTLVIPAGDPQFFVFGYVTYDGLSIGIRDCPTNTAILLRDPPPPEWVGVTAAFTGGCDRKVATCRNRWNNEQRFGGIGIKLPPYHPLVGSP